MSVGRRVVVGPARNWAAPLAALLGLFSVGCMSPYHTDRGALFGGLGGAGVGAIVGNALGNPAAGAVLGAGAGALTGAAVGSGLDQVEAKNRAMIESRLGRQLPPGSVTINDVIAMSDAKVEPEVIAEHIRHNGMVAPPSAGDLIFLKEHAVDPAVVRAMQAPPVRQAGYQQGGPPAVVERHYYADPYYYPPPYYSYGVYYDGGCRPRCHSGWGVSVGSGW